MKSFPFAITLSLAVAATASARWAMVAADTPVETLVKTYRQRVQKSPADAQAWYILGRVHSMAFATGEKKVAIWKERQGTGEMFPAYQSVRVTYEEGIPLTPERRDHLVRSLYAYTRATKLAPDQPLNFLGLGWMHEMAAKVPGVQPDHSAKALAAYRTVVKLRGKAELGYDHYGISADSRLAQEAGSGIIRLLKGSSSAADRRESQEMTAMVAKLKEIPQPITPILIPLQGESNLEQLLSTRTTRFDLAGDGVARDWPWVQPETGILCWDPTRSGQITSGRQLFGSATWWMFFRDGYEALSALDQNGDGWLRDAELSGISVWSDRNQNGVSDPGEVVPVTSVGVTGLACRATHRTSSGPSAQDGVEFGPHRKATSFDWVPTGKPIR